MAPAPAAGRELAVLARATRRDQAQLALASPLTGPSGDVIALIPRLARPPLGAELISRPLRRHEVQAA